MTRTPDRSPKGGAPAAPRPGGAPGERVRARRSTGVRLRVDWPSCTAHGLCHELVPELVGLDEWGYPVLAEGEVPADLDDLTRQAVDACPRLALRRVAAPPR